MNWMLLLLFCVGFIGCASTEKNKYIGVYNEAVSNGQSAVIIKEGDFATTKEGIEQDLKSVGYSTVLFTNPTQACDVLVKDIDYGNPLLNNDAKDYQIILKYTKIEDGKTRIDLVNGAAKAPVKDEVDKDIRKLADMIKAN